jgi:hypothetical protein
MIIGEIYIDINHNEKLDLFQIKNGNVNSTNYSHFQCQTQIPLIYLTLL